MLLKSILDFLFPRYCEMCGERLSVNQPFICHQCDEKLPRTLWWRNSNPIVERYRPDDVIFQEIDDRESIITEKTKSVSNPFTENELAMRLYGRADIERAMSFIKYVPKSKSAQLVYGFKYHDKPFIASLLGEMMGKELGDVNFFSGIDYLLPMPITKKRKRKRGYNQSTELAKGISKVTNIPVAEDVIKRDFFVQSQTKLDSIGRMENIEGAFTLCKKSHNVSNKHVLLIDDVITTGATIIECCDTLKKIQGIRISVLSLGFVTT